VQTLGSEKSKYILSLNTKLPAGLKDKLRLTTVNFVAEDLRPLKTVEGKVLRSL